MNEELWDEIYALRSMILELIKRVEKLEQNQTPTDAVLHFEAAADHERFIEFLEPY